MPLSKSIFRVRPDARCKLSSYINVTPAMSMELPQLLHLADPVSLDEVLGDCLYIPGSFQLLHYILSK